MKTQSNTRTFWVRTDDGEQGHRPISIVAESPTLAAREIIDEWESSEESYHVNVTVWTTDPEDDETEPEEPERWNVLIHPKGPECTHTEHNWERYSPESKQWRTDFRDFEDQRQCGVNSKTSMGLLNHHSSPNSYLWTEACRLCGLGKIEANSVVDPMNGQTRHGVVRYVPDLVQDTGGSFR